MTKLLNAQRRHISDRIIAATFSQREDRLKQEEHALGLRLITAIWGDDALDRIRGLPDGWLPSISTLAVKMKHAGGLEIKLNGSMRVPAAFHGWMYHYIEALPEVWNDEWLVHQQVKSTLSKEKALLKKQIDATLSAISAVEKLAIDWPEGYAHFPHEMLSMATGIPVVRIEDLNARLAAAKAA